MEIVPTLWAEALSALTLGLILALVFDLVSLLSGTKGESQ